LETQVDSAFPDLNYNSNAILASKRIFNHVMSIRVIMPGHLNPGEGVWREVKVHRWGELPFLLSPT
jgi:hypothetical protein